MRSSSDASVFGFAFADRRRSDEIPTRHGLHARRPRFRLWRRLGNCRNSAAVRRGLSGAKQYVDPLWRPLHPETVPASKSRASIRIVRSKDISPKRLASTASRPSLAPSSTIRRRMDSPPRWACYRAWSPTKATAGSGRSRNSTATTKCVPPCHFRKTMALKSRIRWSFWRIRHLSWRETMLAFISTPPPLSGGVPPNCTWRWHRRPTIRRSPPSRCSADDVEALASEVRQHASVAFDLLKDRVPYLPDEVIEIAAAVLSRRRQILQRLQTLGQSSSAGATHPHSRRLPSRSSPAREDGFCDPGFRRRARTSLG